MECWSAPEVCFDEVTLAEASQAGTPIDFNRIVTEYAVQWECSWSAGDFLTVSLSGSLDGTSWYSIGASYHRGTAATSAGTAVSLGTASGVPARYVRAWGYAAEGSPVASGLLIAR